MKRAIVALLMMLGLAAGVLTGVPSSSAGQQSTEDDALLQAGFVPCQPAICGRFPANTAALGLKRGMVVVSDSGVVRITIRGLTVLSTGAIAANQVLEVHVGSFTTGAFEDAVPILGRITTDEDGQVMPPPSAKNPLSDEEKATLKRWIADGRYEEVAWDELEEVRALTLPRGPWDTRLRLVFDGGGERGCIVPIDVAEQYGLLGELWRFSGRWWLPRKPVAASRRRP